MNGTLNKVILIGRMGNVVKLTYFSEGNCIGQFPLATDDEYTNRATNERISSTEWHTVIVRNKLAELVEKYTHKGDLIYVEGRIKTRKWQTEDGAMRYMTEIHATDVTFTKCATAPSPSPWAGATTRPTPAASAPASSWGGPPARPAAPLRSGVAHRPPRNRDPRIRRPPTTVHGYQ